MTARHQVRTPVTVRVAGAAGSRRATLVDLGLTGARLELDEVLVPGTETTLEVRTPLLWDPLQLRGQVVWAQGTNLTGVAHAGIRFHHDSGPPLLSLFELLSSQDFEP
jgi:hypothetical protein